MNGSDDAVQAQLRALQVDYAARLPGRAADISARFDALRSKWCPREATELRRLVHNLAGSGASYGFATVSAEARLVERALDATIEAAPTTASLAAVAEALRGLVGAALAARID